MSVPDPARARRVDIHLCEFIATMSAESVVRADSDAMTCGA